MVNSKEIGLSSTAEAGPISMWSNWLVALPLIGVFITLLPMKFVITHLWVDLPTLNFPQIDNLDRISFFVANVDARTLFFVAQLLLAVAAAVTIILMGYVFYLCMGRLSNIYRAIWLVVLFAAILIAVMGQTEDFYEPIFEPTLGQIKALEKTYDYTDPQFIDKIDFYTNLINSLVVIGIVMIMGGFAASLYTPRNGTPSLVNDVASQRQRLLLVLYSGMALLICGVIATHAFVRVPAVFLAENSTEHAQYMSKVALMITTTFGIGFTLCLAGGYLPASIVISLRARNLAERLSKEEPGFDPQEWLKKQNLTTSPLQYLTRTVAVLGPFLVSLSQVIGSLF